MAVTVPGVTKPCAIWPGDTAMDDVPPARKAPPPMCVVESMLVSAICGGVSPLLALKLFSQQASHASHTHDTTTVPEVAVALPVTSTVAGPEKLVGMVRYAKSDARRPLGSERATDMAPTPVTTGASSVKPLATEPEAEHTHMISDCACTLANEMGVAHDDDAPEVPTHEPELKGAAAAAATLAKASNNALRAVSHVRERRKACPQVAVPSLCRAGARVSRKKVEKKDDENHQPPVRALFGDDEPRVHG